jgi:putative addiction module killer protein
VIVIEVRRYVTPGGSDVIGGWLSRLADLKARARIAARLDRLAVGNFGDCKALRDGVSELRIDWGPECVLLLCEGDKPRQSSDTKRAIEYLKDFKESKPGK